MEHPRGRKVQMEVKERNVLTMLRKEGQSQIGMNKWGQVLSMWALTMLALVASTLRRLSRSSVNGQGRGDRTYVIFISYFYITLSDTNHQGRRVGSKHSNRAVLPAAAAHITHVSYV
jgi:hypothetical protein